MWPSSAEGIPLFSGHSRSQLLFRHSSESRCMFKLTEGMAETQELAWGAETDSMRALLAGEAEETKVWNMWVSSFKDRAFC